MLPQYYIFSTASSTLVAYTQALIAGVPVNMNRSANLLNLGGTNQCYNFSGFNRNLIITVSPALTGIGTITIVGWNNITGVTGETISTINDGPTNSVNAYSDVYSVTFNLIPGQTIPAGTTINIGAAATGTAIIPLDTTVYFQQVNVAANIASGTATYTVSQTLDNCIYPTTDNLNRVTSGNQYFQALTSMTAATTSKIAASGDILIPIAGLELNVTASTGQVNFTILQQGGAFR